MCEDNIFGRLTPYGHQLLRLDAVQANPDLRRSSWQCERRLDRHSGGKGEGTFSRDVHPVGSVYPSGTVGGPDVWIGRVPLQNTRTQWPAGLWRLLLVVHISAWLGYMYM